MKNSRRRGLLIAAGAVCLMPITAVSQQPGRVYRIGWLSPTSPSARAPFDAFRESLRRFGYVEGRNLIIEARWADGNLAALPALARSLVELKVDVICAA